MTDPTMKHGPWNQAPEEPALEGTARSSSGTSDLAANRESSCRLVLELLPEAVGGDLDEGTELAIARHVSSCHSCGSEWASMRRAHRALTSLSEGDLDGTSRMDDVFFAELHQDIIGELKHREQLDKDQRVLEKARNLPRAPRRDGASVLSSNGLWDRFRAPLVHVASLAAAVLLGILIGKQFDTGTAGPNEDLTGNGAIKVLGESSDGPMRGVENDRGPRVRRIDERATDEEFRAYLDGLLKDLYLPQPVVPNSAIPELPKDASREAGPRGGNDESEARENGASKKSPGSMKKGQDF